MRLGILGAVLVFLALAFIGVHFPDELKQLWPWRYQASADEEQRMVDARKKLPFVSLTSRLPKGKPIRPAKALSAESQALWEKLDQWEAKSDRTEMLQALHEKTRNIFVGRFGAGKGRMLETPEEILMDADQDGDRRQPGEPANFPLSSSEAIKPLQPNNDFRELHQWNVLAFLPPRSFGFAKDREHVAGFRPHGFRHVWDHKQLRVDHVLLIGILTHEKPVVYLTEKLPSMDQIRRTEIRLLDLVEDAGLSALQHGEDLYIVSKEDTMRMVGALRATKTCLKCHDAEAGDLLGAFSYTLRHKPS